MIQDILALLSLLWDLQDPVKDKHRTFRDTLHQITSSKYNTIQYSDGVMISLYTQTVHCRKHSALFIISMDQEYESVLYSGALE